MEIKIQQQIRNNCYLFEFDNGETVELFHDEGDDTAGWEWYREDDDGEDDYLEGGLWFNRCVFQWNDSVLNDYDGAEELPKAVFVALKSLGVDVSECEL